MNLKDQEYREDCERSIITSLYEEDMTFSEAARLLGVSNGKIKEMFESFNWIPSSKYMQEIHEIQKESIAYIEEESKHAAHQPVNIPRSYKFLTFDFANLNPISNMSILATNIHFNQERAVSAGVLHGVQSAISRKIEGWYQ